MDARPLSPQLPDWLVRVRPSHLPAVWSGCLAGVWLGGYVPGAERPDRLAVLLVGVTALYVAGAFLQDAFDPFPDATLRPAWMTRAGTGLLAGGIILLAFLGWQPLVFALVLGSLVGLAGRWDERPLAGPALLGAGRFLLYPLASAASLQPALPAAAVEGLLLAAYIFGASILAQDEDFPDGCPARWPWLLVALPVVANAALAARIGPARLVVVALPVFWLLRVAFGRTAPLGVGRGAALLAGIVLVDLSAVVAWAPFLPWPGWFALLFVLALGLWRLVPTA